MNKVPTILTYNNHDILLKKKSAVIIGTQIQLLHCGEMGCSVFEASVFCAKYYLVQVKKWEESGMFDKKFKRESLKWISMTCFSDHAENVVFSTYSISALVLYSANWYKSCRSFCRPQMSYSAVKNKYIFNHSEKKVEHNLVVVVW